MGNLPSVILRNEHWLEAGKNCIIRSITQWVITQYYVGDQIENKRWARHVARIRQKINGYRLLMGKSDTKITWKTWEPSGQTWRAFVHTILKNRLPPTKKREQEIC
jgi:hypothetical protein